AAATAVVTHAVETAGDDPRRRALAQALASDVVYGIRGGKRAAAAAAIRAAEKAGDAAAHSLHRAPINLARGNAHAAEGLGPVRLARPARLGPRLSVPWPHAPPETYRPLWSRYNEDLDTARSALRRCIAHAEDAGDEFTLRVYYSYLATTEELAGH